MEQQVGRFKKAQVAAGRSADGGRVRARAAGRERERQKTEGVQGTVGGGEGRKVSRSARRYSTDCTVPVLVETVVVVVVV